MCSSQKYVKIFSLSAHNVQMNALYNQYSDHSYGELRTVQVELMTSYLDWAWSAIVTSEVKMFWNWLIKNSCVNRVSLK